MISKTMKSVVLLLTLAATSSVAGAGVPTFQDLMDPSAFPDAQRGMKVESASEQDGAIRIVTTGAVIIMDGTNGEVAFLQRIGQERPVAMLKLGQELRGAKITHSTEGFARVTLDQPKITIRVNGDSLFLLQPHEPLKVEVETKIIPAWNASWMTNHLVVDELGGFGLYCSDLGLDDQYDAFKDTIASYPLPADAVLSVGVCPPKPYDWDRSLREQVIWHWSDKLAYPPDDELRSWKPNGTMVLLQSEVLLWKDWNLDFVPRLGIGEYERVRNTLHGMDMPFIVYTSPYFFLKGTAQEKQAVNDKPGVCPGAIVNGENMPLFLEAITRVMRDLKPDGLYFDGQYMENPAALYALARHARRIIGETGILEWHSTTELGKWGSLLYMPQADAYTDIQLRGEGQDAHYADRDYVRFFVSGYNINNCIGVLCNNSGREVSIPMLESLLEVNGRLHTLKPDFINKEYRPRLAGHLREKVDRAVLQRQAEVPKKADALRAFWTKGPDWKETPMFALEFEALPKAETLMSPKNNEPFSIVDGALHIRAHASAYAYLRVPIDRHCAGFVVRVRQGTDGGMSWGPGAMIRWINGDGIRVGSRPAELQADVMGTQTVAGPGFDPKAWIWLRARWDETTGVVEYSRDGASYTKYFTFSRNTPPTDTITELLVGKVPYNGQPQDNADPGDLGECDIDFVRLYDR